MNVAEFFNGVRNLDIFGGSLSQHQVDGINSILNEWSTVSGKSNVSLAIENAQLAYILATARREVGSGMYPVREGYASSDSLAIAHVTDMFNRHQISHNYAAPDPHTGLSYFGRGIVQLTWADNYKNIGNLIDVDLYHNPDLALDPVIAATIAVRGMVGGWFTGVGLSKYINQSGTDFVNARRIINGTDVASLVASYATKFLTCIIAAA
jgi:putative chitinase